MKINPMQKEYKLVHHITTAQRMPAELGTAHAVGTWNTKSKDYNSTV